jgi:flagellar protein FliO/FliZ
MDAGSYIQAILALAFVVGLIGLASFALKKLSDKQFAGVSSKQKRLKIEEVCALDTRRRLILLKRDDVEHLILLGANSELLIESNIQTVEKPSKKESK